MFRLSEAQAIRLFRQRIAIDCMNAHSRTLVRRRKVDFRQVMFRKLARPHVRHLGALMPSHIGRRRRCHFQVSPVRRAVDSFRWEHRRRAQVP